MSTSPFRSFGIAFFITLFSAMNPAFAQKTQQEEMYSLKEGKVINKFKIWLKGVEALQNSKNQQYKSAHEDEYVRHWIDVTRTNIERLSKRDKISMKKWRKYSDETKAHYEAFARYTSLKSMLSAWQGMLKSPGGKAHVKKERQRLIASKNPLFALNGQDPYALFEKIAKESRPAPIKLDDVTLVIKRRPIDAKKYGNQPDYWARGIGKVELDVTNTGEDKSEFTWLSVTATVASLQTVSAASMSCKDLTSGDYAECSTHNLAPSETKTMSLTTKLRPKAFQALSPENKFRTKVKLDIASKSEKPEAAAEPKKLVFTARDCVASYRHNLNEYKNKDLQNFKKQIALAVAPNDKLRGSPIYRYKKEIFDQMGVGEAKDVVHATIWNKGPDVLLSSIGRNRHALADLQNLGDNLSRESVPGKLCAVPGKSFKAALKKLNDRKAKIDRIAKAVRRASAQRVSGFKAALKEGVQGDATTETVKGGATEVTLIGAEKGTEKLAEEMAKQGFELSKKAKSLSGTSKAIPIVSLLNSLYSMYDAWVAYDAISPQEKALPQTLGLLEAAAYLEGLQKRYNKVVQLYQQHFNRLDKIYNESCTCRDPF